jgi:small-conductance mechanosensitive channel
VPMTTEAARFWHQRLVLFVGTFVFGWVTIALVLRTLGVVPPHLNLIAYALGLLPLVVALETVWRRPEARHANGERKIASPLAASLVLVVIWLAWVVGAMPTFWLLVVLFFTPLAIGTTRRSILHLLRPVTSDDGEQMAKPSAWSVLIERIARALLILGAVLVLAWAWEIDFQAMAAQDTTTTRLARGMLNAVIILLVADLIWQVVKTTIDERMEEATQQPGAPGTEEARKKSRLRTLLPIARNILFIVFAVMAVLMALSSLGIEVGPLIAGAGVVGVAIGFGAQTLVKDVISGVFYLLDDAFRVGEYIQAGSYKGTVESFSLRSVKLRHHRGPLYTVPFGELGAIQNMSRDWVIDVLRVSVTYDTDLDKVKRIIKEIGKQLQADPEFAPNILQTLKMQGVDQFGDFAITIRLKMMTKPGEQFTIRRRAFAMIKKAFKENGIEFAFPTVTVAGGESKDVSPAVLKEALDLTRPPAAAT